MMLVWITETGCEKPALKACFILILPTPCRLVNVASSACNWGGRMEIGCTMIDVWPYYFVP